MRGLRNATKCIPGSSCCKGWALTPLAWVVGLDYRRCAARRRAAEEGAYCGALSGKVEREKALGARTVGSGAPAEAAAAAALSGERGELRNPVTRAAPISGWTGGLDVGATVGRSFAPRAAQRSLRVQKKKKKNPLVSVVLRLR